MEDSDDPRPAREKTNSIDGHITKIEQIGHIVLFEVQFPNGSSISIESHEDQYRRRFRLDEDIQVSWNAADATVIAH